ncbi:hypothetical protein ACV1DV_21410 [Aeromonas veronii]
MALPWLIGGAILGLGALLASSDDDDDDDEEQRRRERAAHERAERERAERTRIELRQTAQAEFKQYGNNYVEDFSQALEGWVKVTYALSPYQVVLNDAGELRTPDVTPSFVSDYELDFLSNTTQKNLHHFETFYDIELTPEQAIYDAYERLSDCHEALEGLKFYQRRLEQFRQQLKDNA